jgi:hypothetical protein
MKTINSIVVLIAGIVLLASCSGNLQIVKRHYRNGWYVSRLQEKTAGNPSTVSNSSKNAAEVAVIAAEPGTTLPAVQQGPGSPLAGNLLENVSVQTSPAQRKNVDAPAAPVSVSPVITAARPTGTEDPEKKNATVTVFASLSALSLMAALLLVSSPLFPLFLVFGLLFAITAIGIYFQKKEPSNKVRHESPEGSISNEAPAFDKATMVVLGGITLLVAAFFLFAMYFLFAMLSHF